MYDIERITNIIKDIEKYKKDLEMMKIKSPNELEDIRNLHASSMLCFAILNRVIDLGQEILIKEELGMPEKYADIFSKLSEVGLMNKKEADEMNELIRFRNILAHSYFELGKKDIFKIISHQELIDKFIEKIKKRVKKINNTRAKARGIRK